MIVSRWPEILAGDWLCDHGVITAAGREWLAQHDKEGGTVSAEGQYRVVRRDGVFFVGWNSARHALQGARDADRIHPDCGPHRVEQYVECEWREVTQ